MKYLSGSGLSYFYKKLMQELSNKAPSAHSHSWNSITNKPTTFTPSSHNHSISNVTGLQGEIDALKKSVSDGKSLLATSITKKKVPTQATDTFTVMASNIDKIKLGSGNAQPGDVLSGKTFTNDTGNELIGTMTNRGAWGTTINPGGSVIIPQGYHNGNGTVTVKAMTFIDLGTGTSFDVKSKYSGWASLNANNFFCVGFERLKIAGGGSQNYGDFGNAVQTEITQEKSYSNGILTWKAKVHSWNYDSNGTRNHVYGDMQVHAYLIIQ